MRIAFTGGGTGGHITPIIAVAREIRRIAEEERILDLELYYFGPELLPAELAEAEQIISSRIRAGKLRRYFSLWNFTDVFKIAFGICEALWKMFAVMPDALFCKGGFGSFPLALAARIYRIPVMVHESDARPGQVNRWAGQWARRVAISFAGAAEYFPAERTALTGVPIRSRISGGSRGEAEEVFGVFSGRPVIFAMGGSQGAAIVNRTLVEVLRDLLARYEVIHQAGPERYEDLRLETMPLVERSEAAYYHLVPFLDEDQMRSAYFLADMIVARAGGTAIFEIAAAGKPAILVPIKIAAQDHQRANAYEYARTGAAIVIEEDNLTPSVLAHEIHTLIADPARRARMTEAAKSFAKPDAARTIARELLSLGLH
ncbi:MAG: UDP-N-acetylglucosamine--N-acetylmuramyl-(pentapeptide) pyrophosphoryl-undecaprenol N-acetylglucosamine transferase [Candidatus Sungbacteria bacterium]|uniref:UDP-N-acetylglucosamine--N-acetylmuramyl-(pentapeptide) pyrophosphoryl-undecaprenol N-acetylglucosamine transferase n=1 Tax=Candidatus Sungiibacteriota bacterium TaxID=2750080 RepID=A0A932YVV1_9BACT|nr:UDP-N-acetylglucosamine--N-acetylmuramyl-(pentapeptide) pyrophosphoryl-undecaprenol N-acetylglucosamine transferase [Candidatus Sungbacteria bacterium]